MNTRILMAMTSHSMLGSTGKSTGAYLPEIAHPLDVFSRAGYEVDFASVAGGTVPLDGLDTNDEVTVALRDNPERLAKLNQSRSSRGVNASEYGAIFFAGGHGTMWDFPDDPGFQEVARRIYERGGVVAAVCHGPAALVNLRLGDGRYLISGKTVSAFTNQEERAVALDQVVPFLLEDRLKERGALFSDAPMWQSHVVTSERLVTGQNPASAGDVAQVVIGILRHDANAARGSAIQSEAE